MLHRTFISIKNYFLTIKIEHTRMLYPVLILVISFAVFIPSLKNGFVWDDNPYLVEKLDSLNFHNIPYYFIPKNDIYAGQTNYYRPVMLSSLSLDNELWKGKAFGFHLTNILLHSLASLMVYVLVLMLLKEFKYEYSRERIAALSALLFALHPIHVEPVSFILARSDLLCSVFLMSSIIFYILSRNSIYYIFASALSVLLCVFSKETGIVAPVLIIALEFFKPNTRRFRVFAILLIFLITVTLYLILRARIFAILPNADLDFDTLNSFYLVSKSSILAVCYYYYKLIFPFDFNAYVVEVPADYINLFVYTLIVTSVISSCIYSVRRSKLIYLFLQFWILLTIFPALLVPMFNPDYSTFSDRFLYIPSIGFCLIVSLLHHQLRCRFNNNYFSFILIIPIIALYILFTVDEQKNWRNELSLWSATVQRSPDYVIPRMNFGYALLTSGETEKAMSEFKQSLDHNIKGTNTQKSAVAENIALVYMLTGKFDEAAKYFDKALEYDPSYESSYYYNLGLLSFLELQLNMESDDYNEFLLKKTSELLNKAYKIDNKSAKLNLLLAEFYLFRGDMAKAKKFAEASLKPSRNNYLNKDSTKRALDIIEQSNNR